MIKFNYQLFADTEVTGDLVQRAWAKQLWKEAETESFFAKFTGEGPNYIIQKVNDLKKDAGDKITIALMMKLAGNGVTGDSMLEGNEEQLITKDFSVEVDQIRNAVRLKGKLAEQKTQINLRTAAKDSLKVWLAEKNEKDTFAALTANPTASRVIYAGKRTSEATVTGTDVFTTDLISAARRKAMLATPKIRPVNVKGKNYYVMIIDSYQARDLKNDAKWLAAQQHANIRGEDNPIFSGALGVYDGVVLHEHENVIRTATGASSAYVGHALLLGCQAGVLAVAQEPEWKEKAFDYDNKAGFACGMIRGIAKSVYEDAQSNNFDFGVIQVISSSVAD